MKRLVVAVLMLSACGPDLGGTYSGAMSETGPCTDGSSVHATETWTWAVMQHGSSVEIALPGAACNPLEAVASGNTLTVGQKTCAPTSNAGWTLTQTVLDGSAVLNGQILSAVLHVSLRGTSSSGSANCNVTVQGALAQQ